MFPLLLFGSLALSSFFAIADKGLTRQVVSGLALVSVIAALYPVLGHRALACDDERAGSWYLAIVIPMACMLFLVSPAFMPSLFGLYPLCYSMVDRLRTQLIAAGTLSIGVVIANAYVDNWTQRAWFNGLVIGGVSLLFSIVMGNWIGGVIKLSKARQALIEELQSTRAELAQAQHETGVRDERERLSAEIHDTLAQGFSSILMLVRSAQSSIGVDQEQAARLLASAADTAQDNLNEARALVNALAPVPLQHASLGDALRRLGERFQTDTGIVTDVTIIDLADVALRPAEDVVLLRAVQESLTNVRRHAGATSVMITLDYSSTPVRAQVIDNGHGFETDTGHTEGAGGDGRGISGMRARIGGVGGQMRIESAPGRTAVEVTLG